MKKVLAIIPARGGSKGIKLKNIYPLNGLPLISYTIRHCLESEIINRIVVSTDNKEIAEVANQYGAETPFLRPKEISQDDSNDYSCIEHCIKWLKKNEDYEPDVIVQMRCTTPLRNVNLIDDAINYFIKNPDADSLRALAPACFSPFKMWIKNQGDYIRPILKLDNIDEPYNEGRQKLPQIFQQDGFIDITTPKTINELKSLTGNRILGYKLKNKSIDIDDNNDLIEAAKLLKEN